MRHFTNKLSRPGILVLTVSLCAVLVGGCKTDELAGPKREVAVGPMTSLESPAGINVPNVKLDRTEVDLVEELLLHRAMYARLLRALNTYYTEHGNEEKAVWARSELNDLKRVKPYRYILDSEVPTLDMTPSESIAEADQLYDEACALMKKGGHKVPALYNQETMKLALAKFKELVDRHPTSDKIDDAAFFIGEIHKEYFEEKDNTLAIEWYKRAIQWNPDTAHPARFQIAVCYDYRLHEREEALYWYQQVLEHEPDIEKTNTLFASNRIRQLTTEKTRHAPGDIVPETPGGETLEANPAAPAVP